MCERGAGRRCQCPSHRGTGSSSRPRSWERGTTDDRGRWAVGGGRAGARLAPAWGRVADGPVGAHLSDPSKGQGACSWGSRAPKRNSSGTAWDSWEMGTCIRTDVWGERAYGSAADRTLILAGHQVAAGSPPSPCPPSPPVSHSCESHTHARQHSVVYSVILATSD